MYVFYREKLFNTIDKKIFSCKLEARLFETFLQFRWITWHDIMFVDISHLGT